MAAPISVRVSCRSVGDQRPLGQVLRDTTSSFAVRMPIQEMAEPAEWLRAVSAQPVIADAFDKDHVMRALAEAQPDIVINQLISLPQDPSKAVSR